MQIVLLQNLAYFWIMMTKLVIRVVDFRNHLTLKFRWITILSILIKILIRLTLRIPNFHRFEIIFLYINFIKFTLCIVFIFFWTKPPLIFLFPLPLGMHSWSIFSLFTLEICFAWGIFLLIITLFNYIKCTFIFRWLYFHSLIWVFTSFFINISRISISTFSLDHRWWSFPTTIFTISFICGFTKVKIDYLTLDNWDED